MSYKDRDTAKMMAEYYEELADKEGRKKELVEKAVRERIIEVLNKNKLTEQVSESIKRDLELLDEIGENEEKYKNCCADAWEDVRMFDNEEQTSTASTNEANTGMEECARIFAQDVEETISKEAEQ